MVSGSRFYLRHVVSAILILSGLHCGSLAAQAASRANLADAAAKGKVTAQFGKLPLSFEPVSAGGEAFVSRGMGYSLLLTRSGAELKLKSANAARAAVRMEIAGANPGAKLSGERKLAGTANYFVGSDPAKWRRNVQTYGAVLYANVYRGIDLVFYGNRGKLEYDFVVGPDADPAQIRIRFDGSGALAISESGDLAVGAGESQIEFHKPVVYQQIGGRRRRVAGQFALLDAHTVGFELGRYDRARPLVIDPTLAYGTYIGGSGFPGDLGYGVAVDKDGSAYVTGEAESSDFPVTAGAFQTVDNGASYGSAQVFVSKFNAAGTALVYSTYIGGTYGDHARAIAVDSNNCAYVTGYTFSYDYPATVGAFMTSSPSSHNGVESPFVTKLTPAGDGLVYSTFLGGSGAMHVFGDEATSIAVDANLNAYVAGEAYSSDFPVTTGAIQTQNNANNSGSNAFLTKLSLDGKGLVYSTYLGGSGVADVGDEAAAVAVDGSGNAYIAGYTYSSDFPVTSNAFQKINHGYAKGNYNAFVAKVNGGGTSLVYSTLLGGTGIASYGDRAYALAVDRSGDAFVGGEAFSTDFPIVAGALQPANLAGNNASTNAFITKLNPSGSGLIYSTFLGGSGLNETTGDYVTGIALDGNGNAYLAGTTYSTDFPVTANALQKTNRAAYYNEANAFVALLNAAGNGLPFSTYLGGSGADVEKGMAADGAGNVYITGESFSTDFPVTNGAFQTSNHGAPSNGTNAFVAKLSLGVLSSATGTRTALAASANPAASGTRVTFTATVSATTGTAEPAGSVVFSVDGVAKATVALASRTAKYSTAALVAGPHTVKAAYTGNSAFSASSASLTETIQHRVAAAPRFTPAAGVYAPNTLVKLTDATPGATIHYTINGTTPTAASAKYTAAGIKIAKTETIKAMAVAAGYSNGSVASAVYTIKPPAPKPVFKPGTENFKISVIVKLSDTAKTGLAIYYTTNGAAPTTASAKYTSAGIRVTKTETIKAIAVATGYSKSPVASATYTLLH